ncbi:MAG: hypothetical protein JO143_05835 [Acetobacteraceae bacterium]|nr:hypothetical protein [Acetobacteraceae bacterium]
MSIREHAAHRRGELGAERDKLLGEQLKLNAEAAKLNRDRWWHPALAIVGLIGGIVTAGGAIWHALHGGSAP